MYAFVNATSHFQTGICRQLQTAETVVKMPEKNCVPASLNVTILAGDQSWPFLSTLLYAVTKILCLVILYFD